MKFKSVLIILFISLIYTTSNSAELRVGLTTGVDISSISKKNLPSFVSDGENVKNFAFGIYLEQKLSPYVALQEEVSFRAFGEETKSAGLNIEDEMTYFQINLLFKQSISRNKKTTPYFLIGPSLNINNSASSKNAIQEFDIDNIKKYYPAVIFGGGLRFNMPNLTLSFEGRYFLGFSTILDGVDSDISPVTYALYDRDTGEALDWGFRTYAILVQVSFKL